MTGNNIITALFILSLTFALIYETHQIRDVDETSPIPEVEPTKVTIKPTIKPTNKTTPKWPKNCAEATTITSGFYIVELPDAGLESFYVYCEIDPNGGPAWTRIQHNTDGTVINFAESWQSYKYGFGDVGSDHFIGLEKLYAFMRAGPHELWIALEDRQSIKYNLKYSNFAIGDEETDYKLISLGSYTGYLRDSLRIHVGMQFSTYDRDDKDKCAKANQGGWWYQGCFNTILNGNRKKIGIIWSKTEKQLSYYYRSQMAIRPVVTK